jgi:hypothetical protein
MRQMSALIAVSAIPSIRSAREGDLMRQTRWDEVANLVSGRPYVGRFQTSDLLAFTFPFVKLYVSQDRLVLQPRFGLHRLWRTWVVDREDVAYIGAQARSSIVRECVQIGLDRFTSLDFGTRQSWEIVDRLRDLGYPRRPNQATA